MSDERIENVVTKVRTFLAELKSESGDWPEVTQDELTDLYELVSDILDAKFERDCDNDQVINFRLYDRRTTFPLPYMSVTIVDEHSSINDALTSINDAIGIAEQYNGYAKQISGIMKYYSKKREKDNG